MLMNKKKRCCLALTFAFCIVGIVLISVSLATENWILAKPQQFTNGGAIANSKSSGKLNFGLFHGAKTLDTGLGDRETEIFIVCDSSNNLCTWSENSDLDLQLEDLQALIDQVLNDTVTDQETAAKAGLMTFGLWVATIVFCGLGIVWGLVGASMAIINLATRPIETITGPTGLYVWNTLACLFTLLGVIMFTVLYYMDIKNNVLSPAEQALGWTSKDGAYFGYSFWLLVGASVAFAINIVFVMLAGTDFRPRNYKANLHDKPGDGVMMY